MSTELEQVAPSEESIPPMGRFERRPRGLRSYTVTLIASEVEAFDNIAARSGKTRSELLRELMRERIGHSSSDRATQ